MYAGHAALATVAKARRPRIPIALLVPVAFAPDWIQWIGNAFGHYGTMLSHSLVSVGFGSTLIALLYWAFTRQSGDAFVLWLMYVSHWAADFITGSKPTWPGGPQVGLLLYDHPLEDLALESVLIVLCWMLYRRSLPAESRRRAMLWLGPLGLIGMQIVFEALSDPRLRG